MEFLVLINVNGTEFSIFFFIKAAKLNHLYNVYCLKWELLNQTCRVKVFFSPHFSIKILYLKAILPNKSYGYTIDKNTTWQCNNRLWTIFFSLNSLNNYFKWVSMKSFNYKQCLYIFKGTIYCYMIFLHEWSFSNRAPVNSHELPTFYLQSLSCIKYMYA